jgi:DNA-binding response OmpR family regulator
VGCLGENNAPSAAGRVVVTVAVLVFVVEDEPLIQDMLQAPLKDGGYEVATAASGEEAVSMLEKQGSTFQALITDVNLGRDKLSGWDVAKRARELNPSVAVIYMTGDSGHDWAANGVPNSVLLLKPFAPAQVVTAVSQLLNAPAANVPATDPPGG